jgi:hypothetical protein
MDDEHVLALVEAIHRTDFHAIHVFALDAIFGDDVSHEQPLSAGSRALAAHKPSGAMSFTYFVSRRGVKPW